MLLQSIWTLVLLACSVDATANTYPFKERLDLTPLPRNNLLASFNFELDSNDIQLYSDGDSISTHYTVFPRSFGPILKTTRARELHLRFSQGWWDSEVWGSLPRNGSTAGGTGVEIWSLIEADDKAQALESWVKLVNSLSGLFCASFNFIDESITTYPVKTLQPYSSFYQKVQPEKQLYLLRSALPREPICTENLTPFIKILPAKGKAGISSLLNGHKVFNSQWSSMSIDILTECDDSLICNYNLKQAIDVVLNVPKTIDRALNPIPKPTPGEELRCDQSKTHNVFQCFPLGEKTDMSWDLKTLFGTTINGGSSISSEPSKVCAHVNHEHWKVYAVTGTGDDEKFTVVDDCADLDVKSTTNFLFSTDESNNVVALNKPPVMTSRSLTGHSQDSGGFRTDFANISEDKDVDLVFFETLPWFVRIFLHTMDITITKPDKSTVTYSISDPLSETVLKQIYYSPAVDRKAPTHLELLLRIPAGCSVTLNYQFDKSMLLYAEYPPDANHGFEIDPAVISVIGEEGNEIYHFRTTTSLLTLPTPDFSMPYNVIILTSTVMSLAFGGIFNLLVKRVVTQEQADSLAKVSPLYRVSEKLGRVRTRIRQLLGRA
ncbi:unnamed protein product [Kuraishia capsulata CBS 1993]|uniref:GPI transamidase component GPI16 n=1 Tax=Kuraishia capsulata CBS 1993 TaxID=1382522 RepID=W6MJA7_9ASCO|nr:uncharacterized protein KUCA_T00002009001 [Kuraishia capsulata CBS 1993]CDK26038.1 unnamed protein product [Kuraishia capsulata CBS 1993]